MSAVAAHKSGATISVQVQPKASRTELGPEVEGWLKIRVAAPPVEGAANREIVAWFSRQLKVPKSAVEILCGEKGRKKVILIHDRSPDEVKTVLGLA